MGEFGRTPGPLNGQGGRDHLKTAMCGLMVGGGVAGGQIIGSTDSIGRVTGEPRLESNRGIFVQDITATIYSALGIDWTKSIPTLPAGGAFPVLPRHLQRSRRHARAVNEVFA